MIINVTREFGSYLYEVAPANDDGTPMGRDGNRAAFLPSSHVIGRVWDRVGELISQFGNGSPVPVRFTDNNSLTERIRRGMETAR